METSVPTKIPAGQYRVLCYHPPDGTAHLVKDCHWQKEAFLLADSHNRQRTEPASDVYHVFNDQGEYLRGEEAILDQDGHMAIGVS